MKRLLILLIVITSVCTAQRRFPFPAASSGPTTIFSDNFSTGTNLGASWTGSTWAISAGKAANTPVILPFVDEFSLGSTLSPFWTGATWTVVAGQAKNTPTLGAEMWDAGANTFESGTYQWVIGGGSNTIENVGNALVITYVDNASGAYHYLRDTKDLSADCTVNRWYVFSVDALINTGNYQIGYNTGSTCLGPLKTNTSAEKYTLARFCRRAQGDYIRVESMGAGEVVTIDNTSLKPILPTTSVLATVETGTTDIDISAKVTATAGMLSGIIVSYADTLNYMFAYVDEGSAQLWKIVGGAAAAAVKSAAATYVAGAPIRVTKTGQTYTLYYNGSAISTPATVADAALLAATKHGIFAADSSCRVDSVVIKAFPPAAPGPLYFAITIDDVDSVYARAIGDTMVAYGARMSWYPYYYRGSGLFNAPQMDSLSDAGHEIGIHSLAHSDLVTASFFTITTTNLEPSITIDTATSVITLATSSAGNTVAYNFSGNKDVADLQNAVVGKGWTITATANVSTDNYLSWLASSGGAQTDTPYVALPNYNKYWRGQIIEGADWIQSQTGVRPRTIVTPFGTNSVALENWIRDSAEFIGSRTASSASYAGSNTWSSINVYNIDSKFTTAYKADSTESGIIAAANTLYTTDSTSGLTFTMYTHNSLQMSPWCMGVFVKQIQARGGIFLTLSALIDTIKTKHATVDGKTYNFAISPFSSTRYAIRDAGVANVTVSGDFVISAGTKAGVIVSYADTNNMVQGYHNGTQAVLSKCVAGTWTDLVTATTTYGAGKTIKVVKSGTTYSLYYDGTIVGTAQTISDAILISNTKCGMLSNYLANTGDNFEIKSP
jgi:peptidoglycan/xylan/chitin deacetylase (PgdA/CDA1 family)